MSLLTLHVGTTGVTAVVVTPQGQVVADGHAPITRQSPAPGRVEHLPEEIWRSTLVATRSCLDRWPGRASELDGVGLTTTPGTVVLWDRETLGSPRPAVGAEDARTSDPSVGARLAWLAEHEPNTWALVEQGRYALGTLESYLVARLSRGTWHLTDVSHAAHTNLFDLATGAWSEERCAEHGVPLDALPEVGPSWGRLARTDPRSFVGLDLPVAGIAAEQEASLLGLGCVDAGAAWWDDTTGTLLLDTGAELVSGGSRHLPRALRRSPAGETAYGLAARLPDGSATAGPPTPSSAFEVRALVDAMPISLTGLMVDGSADDSLCQLQADLLGVPVRRGEQVHVPALGAALLAGLGAGRWDSPADLRSVVEPGRAFIPSDGKAADVAYARWRTES